MASPSPPGPSRIVPSRDGTLGFGQVSGFIGALAFGTLGAVLVRIVLRALEGHR